MLANALHLCWKRRCSGTGCSVPDRWLSLHTCLLFTELLISDQTWNLKAWLASQGNNVRHLIKGCQAQFRRTWCVQSRSTQQTFWRLPKKAQLRTSRAQRLRQLGHVCGNIERGICNCVRALQIANILGGFSKMTCLWCMNPCTLLACCAGGALHFLSWGASMGCWESSFIITLGLS